MARKTADSATWLTFCRADTAEEAAWRDYEESPDDATKQKQWEDSATKRRTAQQAYHRACQRAGQTPLL